MAREKFALSAHAERDSGIRKQNMIVIQMMRQTSSYPQLAISFSMSTLLFASVTWKTALMLLCFRQESVQRSTPGAAMDRPMDRWTTLFVK